ncbi:flagellar basal body protein [uncultured Alsobacter sp.]|uniref:flagellar basal body protein n=1 Tax=uncultured Alsobacter sp. TaxID=1748258 RepID=UPI0025E827EB|nr:flagellar basal body protein [uncultured Alsobacter sp.]
MAGIGLPLMEQLKGRMQWLQSRQKLLAQNVANADTPGFKPRDLKAQSSGSLGVTVATTSAAHIGATAGGGVPGAKGAAKFETEPSGNAVTLEDEMLKVAQTQMDFQTAATLYSKSLGLLLIAVGKKA